MHFWELIASLKSIFFWTSIPPPKSELFKFQLSRKFNSARDISEFGRWTRRKMLYLIFLSALQRMAFVNLLKLIRFKTSLGECRPMSIYGSSSNWIFRIFLSNVEENRLCFFGFQISSTGLVFSGKQAEKFRYF